MLSRLELSQRERLRRYYYELARDVIEEHLIEYMLVRSYTNFRQNGESYPFVEMRELKPGGASPRYEHPLHNHLLMVFSEGALGDDLKKNLRFREKNGMTIKNLREFEVEVSDPRMHDMKFLSNADFDKLLDVLLPLDYALIMQQEMSASDRLRYGISHFHVKIDVLLDDMVEQWAKELKYVTRDIYEKGEGYAQLLERKFFEYHSFHETAAGRRSAAMVAFQLLRRRDELCTVFVGSSEARTLTCISERGIRKYILLPLKKKQLRGILEANDLDAGEFAEHYDIDGAGKQSVVIFLAVYEHTGIALPPSDGKVRDSLQPKGRWLTITRQLIVPKPKHSDQRPIHYPTIYRESLI